MTQRQCGSCTLCCTLLPVVDLKKAANVRCQHLSRTKRCKIYDRRPISCRVWNCIWLVNDDADDLARPDRSHYVIDMMPDIVRMIYDDTGETREIPVVQVWVDPKHPGAHKDPALRAYLFRRAMQGVGALIRFNSVESIAIFAPPMSADGKWHEITSVINNPEMKNPFIQDEFYEQKAAEGG